MISLHQVIHNTLISYHDRNLEVHDTSQNKSYYVWIYLCYIYYTYDLDIQEYEKIVQQVIDDFQLVIKANNLIIDPKTSAVIVDSLLKTIDITNHLMLLRK